jgi:hypothetical protein
MSATKTLLEPVFLARASRGQNSDCQTSEGFRRDVEELWLV